MKAPRSIALCLGLILWFPLTLSAPADLIHSSCKVTRYPSICEKYLSGCSPAVQRSPRQLAQAALTISANRALAASTYVRRISPGGKHQTALDGGAVHDCVETLNDSAERMRRSVKEMEQMGSYGSSSYKWHLTNVQTWVSASLSDENSCLESLLEDASVAGVRVPIRRQIVSVSRLTSNALALVNQLES